MVESDYRIYLKSDYWKQVKFAVCERDGHQCGHCGSNDNLTVHHKTYNHLGQELDHLDDLELLCWKCHRKVHHSNPHLRSNLPRSQPKVKNKIKDSGHVIKIDQAFLNRLALTGRYYPNAKRWLGHSITVASAESIFDPDDDH